MAKATTTTTRAHKGKGKATTTRKAQAPAQATSAAQAAQQAAQQAPSYGLRAAPTAQGQRRTAYNEAALVTLLVQHNPKRPGTGAYNRFAQYQQLAAKHGNGAFTVQQVLNAGVQPSDIRYNVKHGFIALADPK